MNYVREYWSKIESGEIVTSRRVKAVYGRLMREMDEPAEGSRYYFDEETGERPIIFIERFCKQSQGTLGAPLGLELFQKAFIQTLFGWLERATGYRRFRETLFLVGRKNGKSTLLAAIALYLLVADYEGAAEIYSVATKRDQAKKTLIKAIVSETVKAELKATVREVVKEVIDEENPIYKDLENVPDYWRGAAAMLLDAGAINGGTPAEVNATDLNIRRETLKAAIVAAIYHEAREREGGVPDSEAEE